MGHRATRALGAGLRRLVVERMNDEAWERYVASLKAMLGQIPEDAHGRRQMHCAQCGEPLLVYLKWLHEEGNCLKWYCCYPIGADAWLEHCPGCGIAFEYPPPLREFQVAAEASE